MNSLQVEHCEDNYDNNERSDITGTKCGEIFTSNSEIFNVLCTFCGTILEDIDEFKLHFKTNHNNKFEDDVEIKIEEISNDDILIDPIGQCLYVEDCVKAESANNSLSSEIITKENVGSYGTIEIEDGNSLKENSSEYFSEKLEKKSNFSDKSKKRKSIGISTSHYCEICNKCFQRGSILNSHKRYDHNPTYSFVDNLENESNSPEDNQIQDRLNLDLSQSIESDPLKCRYCGRRFRRRGIRFEHECLHTGERPFNCTICDKTYRVESTLKAHIRFHENKKEYKCDICGKDFNSNTNLKIHLRRHNNEKPHKCSYCDKRFVYTTDKQSHERTHTGEKPYQCTECGQQYSTSSKLGFHLRRQHIREKAFKCEHCDKSFVLKQNLKRHQVVHNKDYRPYKCDVCDATFQRSYSLTQHKRLHLDVFRYTCNICGKGFKQFAGLYSHKKIHGESLTQ